VPHHYAHYVRRRVRLTAPSRTDCTEAFYRELQSDLEGLHRPRFHTTRSLTGPAARIRSGDTIWLFSKLTSPWGDLPPSLDARIDVGEEPYRVLDSPGNIGETNGKQQQRLRFAAADTSRWFPLADASLVLSALQTCDANGRVMPLIARASKSVGQALQSVRQLHTAAPLLDWDARMRGTRHDFVSYRLKDGTAAAFVQVCALLQQGRAVFWDRWSLPRRIAERREWLNAAAVEAYLEAQINEARVVWGITSKAYGAPCSYSRTEKALAELQGKLVLVPGTKAE
jgi:hypothetical protein